MRLSSLTSLQNTTAGAAGHAAEDVADRAASHTPDHVADWPTGNTPDHVAERVSAGL